MRHGQGRERKGKSSDSKMHDQKCHILDLENIYRLTIDNKFK